MLSEYAQNVRFLRPLPTRTTRWLVGSTGGTKARPCNACWLVLPIWFWPQNSTNNSDDNRHLTRGVVTFLNLRAVSLHSSPPPVTLRRPCHAPPNRPLVTRSPAPNGLFLALLPVSLPPYQPLQWIQSQRYFFRQKVSSLTYFQLCVQSTWNTKFNDDKSKFTLLVGTTRLSKKQQVTGNPKENS